MSRFVTPLDGRWLDDERFMLLADLIYDSDLLARTVFVPRGFVTDFASVPRVPIVYTMFGNRAHHESVIHDFLYQTNQVPRGTADKVFLEAMAARGKSKFIQRAMYWGVVMGGGSSYKSGPSRYQQLNVPGDKGGIIP